MKGILCVLGLLVGSLAIAGESGGQYSGIDLQQGNALQMNLCTLQPRKSMSDLDRVIGAYIDWSKEHNAEVFVIRATPIFGGPSPDGGVDYDWIDFLIGPYSVSGDAWTKWLTGEAGQEINADWLETANCRVVVNPAFIMVLDQEALSSRDDRVMTINWCTRNDGVTTDQMIARHQQMASTWTTDSPIKAWSIMYPGLGVRNPIGEFAHILSFEDANGLMAWQNAIANEEGWRQRQDYFTSYADCVGENVYYGEVLNRPGS